MATEIWDKFRATVQAQASGNPTDGSFSAGAKTEIVKSSGGNAAGCHTVKLMLDVTSAPSSSASVEIYKETSFDGGTTYTAPRFCGSCPIAATTAQKYEVATVRDAGQHSKFSWKAKGYQMTGVLYAQGVVSEVQ